MQGTATVDFGAGATDASVSVSAAGSWTLAEAWPWPVDTTNNLADNHVVENLVANVRNVVPGVSFDIYVKCTFGTANGQYKMAWAAN